MRLLKVSIVIPVRNQKRYLEQCYVSIRKRTLIDYELILVDDASDKETEDYINKLGNIKVVRNDKRMGFPHSCNRGIKESSGEYVCLLNSDTIVSTGWLSKMVNVGDLMKEVGILGPSTNYGRNQKVPEAEHSRPEDVERMAFNITQKYKDQYGHVPLAGFCFLVKRFLFDKVGLFDERFGLGTGEEAEFSWRVDQAGFISNLWVKGAFVFHYGHRSFKGDGIDLHKLWKENDKLYRELTGQKL